MLFEPVFQISPKTASSLMRIEAAKQSLQYLPITPNVLTRLRETARLNSTHYSTLIEGNQLTEHEVSSVIQHKGHFAGREREEKEVLGYYVALERVEQLAASPVPLSAQHIQTLYALVMAEGRKKAKLTPYRDGQNVIRDTHSRAIVYMPPEAKDVPALMDALVRWLATSQAASLPCPIRAGIAHYQFATIHPYYDGNGRTARLLSTLILHLGGYDLKGLYSLEEYYARNLGAYYKALTVGPSHNYYEGRANADVSHWIEYFCNGMAESFDSVRRNAEQEASTGARDHSSQLRNLDPRQRKALQLFIGTSLITSSHIETLFGISQRAARNILTAWVDSGFLIVSDPARKTRKYGLSPAFTPLLQ